jgi:hypothetical protein
MISFAAMFEANQPGNRAGASAGPPKFAWYTRDMSSFTSLSDPDLLVTITRLASQERHATAQLVACLAEVDARRLYLGAGASSLFAYCTSVLRLSDYVELNIIRLMLRSALCEGGSRRGRLISRRPLRSST